MSGFFFGKCIIKNSRLLLRVHLVQESNEGLTKVAAACAKFIPVDVSKA